MKSDQIVVLIEDDPVILSLMTRMFRTEGFLVEGFTHIRTFVDVISSGGSNRFSQVVLILSELEFQGESQRAVIDCLRLVRASRGFSVTPIFIHSRRSIVADEIFENLRPIKQFLKAEGDISKIVKEAMSLCS